MLYPMFALMLLTLAVGARMFWLRVWAVRSGQVQLNHFRLFRTGEEPDTLVQATRNYANLFEMPVLFYAACCASLALGQHTQPLIILAWVYVAARGVHSYVHLTHNRVMTRLKIFMFSNLCLAAIWVLLIFGQLQRG